MTDAPEGRGPTADQRLPRAFTDSVGGTWTVREIKPGPMPEKLSQLLREDRRRGGWLLFMSEADERRRLSPVPEGWESLSDTELEALCIRARRVPPAPARRSQDNEPEA